VEREGRLSGRELAIAAGLAACALLVHLACGGRYGFFRDELYFLACGERLAWGYVDQPPLAPAAARVAHALFGLSVPGLRLLAWLASAGLVAATALLARRLGGGAFAMAAAGAAALASPTFLALGHMLTMNAFESFLALALLLCALAAVEGWPRAWLGAGLAVGLGLMNKYSMALFAAALLAGILLSSARRSLASRWLAAGVAVAALVALPNFLWQARHGFPMLEVLRNGQLYKNAPMPPLAVAASLLVEQGPLAAGVWLAGLAFLLFHPAARGRRWLGIFAVAFFALLTALRAKPYYYAPVFPLLFAAGGRVFEGLVRHPAPRVAAVGLLAAAGLATSPMSLPILPPEQTAAFQERLGLRPAQLERLAMGGLPQHLADQHGWQELAEAVAAVWRELPESDRARALVYGANYGRASAVTVLGAPLGLPAAVSGHNNYFLWGAPPGRGEVVVAVGGREQDHLRFYREVRLAARMPPNPWVMPYESELGIFVLRGPLVPFEELWPRLRHYE